MLTKYIKKILVLKSIKKQFILYLACVAVFLVIKEKDLIFLGAFIIAVSSAILIELFVLYLKTRVIKITESSIITGMIIGYVVSSDEVWWKLVFTATLAILSKYLIVLNKKHIFNPATFGIFLSTILLGVSTQWKGTYMWYILVPFGIYFVEKIRKIETIFGYFIVSLILFGTQAFLQKVSFTQVFGYFSYFYIFIMMIEPKTAPSKVTEKYIFGGGVAILIFILTEIGVRFDAELFSLLIMNIVAAVLSKAQFKKGEIA